MSRRSSRPRRGTAPAQPAGRTATPTAPSACPCGLPAAYQECCGRLHTGQGVAASAEALMRSRYSAFVVRDEAYLLRSWDPRTRPERVDFDPGLHWDRLEVLETTDGSAFHTTGTVTFRAHYRHRGHPGEMEEQSRFARHDGAWVYVDAL
ncbi:YchJ family protein [Streptomyces sp. SAJ15]|uniref:YchJ family protein n=1 Tax=Streptomyces sp. SAJ15 TaxID=2011095 RepID=UPI00135E88A2|nr:YchJ family metal-binding protein [Streptomyces sp. SAJ15]TVL91641.1 hypothetical protein CD790_15485 [Streptomyces sp. SAJ15]